MPTGYTYALLEKKQSFRDFAMSCARAFGACIKQRDDPLDAELNVEVKPEPYAYDRKREAIVEVARLEAMNDHQKYAFGSDRIRQERAYHNEAIAKTAADNALLETRLGEVRQWIAPTPDHEGLKKFMIEQIAISMESDEYHVNALKRLENWTPMQEWAKALASAKHDVEYYEKSYSEEVARCEKATGWIKALCASLPKNS